MQVWGCPDRFGSVDLTSCLEHLQVYSGNVVPQVTETQLPTLITNPADDAAFRNAAQAALQEGQSVAQLQEILRREYPRALVRARDLAGERPVVWYVYRDGHWVTRQD
jgi:hypothetical protein